MIKKNILTHVKEITRPRYLFLIYRLNIGSMLLLLIY